MKGHRAWQILYGTQNKMKEIKIDMFYVMYVGLGR